MKAVFLLCQTTHSPGWAWCTVRRFPPVDPEEGKACSLPTGLAGLPLPNPYPSTTLPVNRGALVAQGSREAITCPESQLPARQCPRQGSGALVIPEQLAASQQGGR